VATKILGKVTDQSIDPDIQEFGVKKVGGDINNYKEYDELMTKTSRKSKKCSC
jgi:hypothetical protein